MDASFVDGIQRLFTIGSEGDFKTSTNQGIGDRFAQSTVIIRD